MMALADKAPDAFRTIGELSQELGVPQHILRYWESKFPQLRPLQRAGNRRYYRAADVALARRIHTLLNQDGYTIRGVQKLLADKAATPVPAESVSAQTVPASVREAPPAAPSLDVDRLIRLRDRLSAALSA
ncbi:MerR family transcriptional regulator [Sphingomonas sp. RB1R13]|uniref:MerR family transcriptional regulator n=1 Tax=Sphingomonas sp. RB1R13 TaxID=3096159 RepID=UPI002FC9A998